MLVGVDWGGTKIEAIAIADDGQPIARLREATPRSDYDGCLATIATASASVTAPCLISTAAKLSRTVG